MTRPPKLLLCFDAFGTLFRPKRSVTLQYAQVARSCGITNFADDDVQAAFKDAFKQESKRNPNYGKATGLGATQWWTNVINNTFTPLLPQGHSMPRDLAPRLLHRFSSNEGYDTEPSLAHSLRSLKCPNSKHYSEIVSGVITNSDNRVPDILSSFGLRVSSLRYGKGAIDPVVAGSHDIDFHCMSYDVGVEKPDQLIFRAAESMLKSVLKAQGKSTEGSKQSESHDHEWLKVYVGDEYAKDVEGSVNAGWKAILLAPDGSSLQAPEVEECADLTISAAFEKTSVMKVKSISNLVAWLTSS
ncbi:hypothetical protein LIA77_05108 [Sarocladium implicatum]|nr:hypothetical protein LIA77_05108 [Sarocladium implicatum]